MLRPSRESHPVSRREFDPLGVDTPSPEDGPSLSADALRNPDHLPAQIGGIVGAYALSLVLVAIALLLLSKKRRRHIEAGYDDVDFIDFYKPKVIHGYPLETIRPPLERPELSHQLHHQAPSLTPAYSRPNLSQLVLPPQQYEPAPGHDHVPYVYPSSYSPVAPLGINPLVDQNVVAADHAMAQQQLEDMYRHVMEHEEAKQRGIDPDTPIYATGPSRQSSSDRLTKPPKKEKFKPANLNLSSAKGDRTSGSKTASFLSALRSPMKKSVKGANISSPIMTPQSSTFPRDRDAENWSGAGAIPPRHYAPAPPPPPPASPGRLSMGAVVQPRAGGSMQPTPDQSPESLMSIDERIGSQLDMRQARAAASHPAEGDPDSATTETSQSPLVGLPQSPKPGATFPSLPLSPKPGASFPRSNAPSAVRTGGSLPLRAYEPSLASPSAVQQTTKQTVFERKGPLSPLGTARTPGTSVPYSPYQPMTAVMPITPSLVTKQDRKRMKKMMPKTPTVEMVQSSDEMW
ncbi:Conserved hypothetical, protein [Geosmithia morbida]|uniref:Conserved hypothetical, protein n=1 Tax=Geosmithia morbida TaxID=1094350 RepID=A0A9P4YYU6_9HYPO|nr:Conserved hypothetical, protein [Geosmithia morbida]KAF4125603.1 Conserved hypothetical, protein [Geosmithia morbida]